MSFEKFAKVAIETARGALNLFRVGEPLIRRGPRGEVHVDVPIMYYDFAIDRMHFDPYSYSISPKGRPVMAVGLKVDKDKIKESCEDAIKAFRVLDAVEFREPENSWAVPIAWGPFIIAHVKVSYKGEEIVPDYGLTEEVKRNVL